jgi:hypothetical protein
VRCGYLPDLVVLLRRDDGRYEHLFRLALDADKLNRVALYVHTAPAHYGLEQRVHLSLDVLLGFLRVGLSIALAQPVYPVLNLCQMVLDVLGAFHSPNGP